MKTACLALFLLLGGALSAAEAAPAPARWEEVLLLDWIYPGEEGYQALKSAAAEVGDSGWITVRLQRGEKVPQASARELAFRLRQDPRISEAARVRLATLLADESELLKESGERDYAARARSLSEEFDAMSRRMDELDEAFKKNNYTKGSVPSITVQAWSGYRLDAGAGLISGRTLSSPLGGVSFDLAGTVDKAQYTLTLGGQFLDPVEFPGADEHGILSGAGFTFVLPLGSSGLEVHLGTMEQLNFSPLLLSQIEPFARDLFFLDVGANYRTARVIRDLELGYPAGNTQLRGIFVRSQGFSAFWPFTATQFIYAPQVDFWQSYNTTKTNIAALRLDEELGPRGALFDNIILYGTGVSTRSDASQIRGTNFHTKVDPQSSLNYAGGINVQMSTGTSLKAEYALAHYEREHETIPGVYAPGTRPPDYRYVFDDNAWIATLAQPVGPFNTAFEAGMAGPRFLNGPHAGVGTGGQAGSTIESLWDIPWHNTAPNLAKAPSNMGWRTMIREPSVLVSNTQRYVAKAQWTGSWLSLGVYDGTVTQINPSGPVVQAGPYIQGKGYNGYGLFKMFGQSYFSPPAPSAPNPGLNSPDQFFLWNYNNRPNHLAMHLSSSATINNQMHWDELSQLAYREGTYTLVLSRNGVGDRKMMADSVKVLNYMGGTAKLDFKSLLTRTLPFELTLTGEVRDLGAQMGLPAFDDSNFFNQQISTAFLQFGLTETLDLLGLAQFETWKTKQSYFQVLTQVREYGLGFDLNLDPFLTGLKVNVRSSWMDHWDSFYAPRAFSLWTLSVGTFLTY